jgi:polysaccharide export outer membrane protein
MSRRNNRISRKICAANGFLLLFSFVSGARISAQTTSDEANHPESARGLVADNYQIGSGDVLMIAVTDAPEFSGKFRVNQAGFLEMSSLPTPVRAEGKTPMELSKDLVKNLESAKLYREPTVNVFVDEYHSQTVSVVGAVAKPGLYSLHRRTSVIEIISEAGLLPTAGNRVTIIAPAPAAGTGNSNKTESQGAPKTLELSRLMRGLDGAANVELHDGEVISVASGEIVYVVGAVTKPGGFVMQDRIAGVSALQAIALAEGTTSIASTKHGLIIRRNGEGAIRENIPIDLSRIMSGKEGDVQLEANDILFVPVSGSKQTLRVMGQVAMMAVNGVAFYGIGYRVGAL